MAQEVKITPFCLNLFCVPLKGGAYRDNKSTPTLTLSGVRYRHPTSFHDAVRKRLDSPGKRSFTVIFSKN